MIRRTLQEQVEAAASRYPVIPTLAERISARGDERWRIGSRLVVYGGEESQSRSEGELVGWADLPEALEKSLRATD